MNPKKYGQMVESGGDSDELWDDFDDLLHGYYDHSPLAPGIINDAILRIERKGWKVDPEAEDALQAFIDGYNTRRTDGFLRRYSLALPDNFMQNIIIMLTVPYPNDVPVKKIKARPQYVTFDSEEDVVAFFTGGVHEDYT